MKKIDIISKSTSFLITLSIFYFILDFSVVMLLPILTVILPYKYLKSNDENKNRKIFRNLLFFNIITFLLVCNITNKVSIEIFEVICNLLVVGIYFLITSYFQSKREKLYENPEKLYQSIDEEIKTLESLKQNLETNENLNDEFKEKFIEIKKDMIKDLDKKIENLKEEAKKISK